MDLGTLVRGYEKPLDPAHFTGPSDFGRSAADYLVSGIVVGDKQPSLHLQRVGIVPSHAPYALLLRARKRGEFVDAAILTFGANYQGASCLRIRGGRKCLPFLAPVKWSLGLLASLAELARNAELTSLTVPSFVHLEGGRDDILRDRYDGSARALGLRYHSGMHLYFGNPRAISNSPPLHPSSHTA